MTTDERRQLEKALAEKNAKQQADANKWKLGGTTYTIGNNSMSSTTGSTTYGLKDSKDRLNGK